MKKVLPALILLILFGSNLTSAQEDSNEVRKPIYFLGGYASYNYNVHLADFNSLPGIPTCCPEYNTSEGTSGTGSGFSFGGLFEIPFNKAISLETRVGFATYNATLKQEELAGNTLVKSNLPPYNTMTRDVIIQHSIDSKLQAATVIPALNFKFFDYFSISGGFNISYLVTSSFDMQEKIMEPDDVTFTNNKITRNELEGEEIPDKNSLLFLGVIGLGVNLEVGDDIYLVPEARYHIPFTDISSVDWKPSLMQIGLALKLPIYKEPERKLIEEEYWERDTNVVAVLGLEEERIELIEEREEIVRGRLGRDEVIRTTHYETYEKQVPRLGKLEASLRTAGVDSDGKRTENPRIIIEELETEEGFPLLPQIFFSEDNSDLSQTDMHLLTNLEAELFKEANLEWNTLEIYSELLNIVGSRMKANPKARLTITGCNSNKGPERSNRKLSEARAESIRDYLSDIWGISESRLRVKSRNLPSNPGNKDVPDGQIENQRAELRSDDFSILEPVMLKEIQRKSNPPLIEIMPNVEAEAGLSEWEIFVMQEGNLIRNYSGGDLPAKIDWNLEEEPVPRLESPLEVSLRAVDATGQEKAVSEDLTIEQLTIRKKRFELRDDKRIERFSLILFEFDRADITAAQRRILSDIKSRITPESKVMISGYADRIGEKDYNKELASRRCIETQKVLQVPEENLILDPVGSDKLLYNNDLPQGRGYSRTVRIVIETPVKE